MFESFPNDTSAAWIQRIARELRCPPEEIGAQYSEGGFPLAPFYALNENTRQGLLPGQRTPGSRWQTWHRIDTHDAAQLTEIIGYGAKHGVDAFFVGAEVNDRIEDALRSIRVDSRIILEASPAEALGLIERSLMGTNGMDLSGVEVRINWSKGKHLSPGLFESPSQELCALIERGQPLRFVVDGGFVNSVGASVVQELVWVLSVVAHIVKVYQKSGRPVVEALQSVSVNLGSSSDFFERVAGCRAFRLLWKALSRACVVDEIQPAWLNVSTTRWTHAAVDPDTNRLRSCTETLSGILGGADSVATRPHNSVVGDVSLAGHRWAWNIQHILFSESLAGLVVDPLAGSGLVESLTDQVAETAWERFVALEADGGLFKKTQAQSFVREIKEHASGKQTAVSAGSSKRIGVNIHPNMEEWLDTAGWNNVIAGTARASTEIESIRRYTDHHLEKHGKRPVVQVVSVGSNSVAAKRTSVAEEIARCGGFSTEVVIPKSDFETTESRTQTARLPVQFVCGTDEDLQSWFVQKKARHAFRSIVVGHPARFTKDDLDLAGIHMLVDEHTPVVSVLDVLKNSSESAE